MRISICIPNFNYAHYIGATLQSILDQNDPDFEVLISDNASTDKSLDVVRGFGDDRLKISSNRCNVGFAANLDRAARMASGELMIMLSSDDLIGPGALQCYRRFYEAVDPDVAGAVVSASTTVIDAESRPVGRQGCDPELWRPEDRCTDVPAPEGGVVYKVRGEELLRRCLRSMKNPFNFLSTAYPRRLYEQIEGYGGNRLMSPDKWFHLRLLPVTPYAYFIDAPLFQYRVHAKNNLAQESASGALKFLVDEYALSFEFDAATLEQTGLSRKDLEQAFVERVIGRHGLATLAGGNRLKAARILRFGQACYPQHLSGSREVLALKVLLGLGPIGQALATSLYQRRLKSST